MITILEHPKVSSQKQLKCQEGQAQKDRVSTHRKERDTFQLLQIILCIMKKRLEFEGRLAIKEILVFADRYLSLEEISGALNAK